MPPFYTRGGDLATVFVRESEKFMARPVEKKRIPVTHGSWDISEIGGGDGPIGLDGTGRSRIFLLRWLSGIGKHRKWRVLFDKRMKKGRTLVVFDGKKVKRRYQISSVGKGGFEIEKIKD